MKHTEQKWVLAHCKNGMIIKWVVDWDGENPTWSKSPNETEAKIFTEDEMKECKKLLENYVDDGVICEFPKPYKRI